MFEPIDLTFDPGLFQNRSARASKRRWIDGNLVRFRDAVPEQMGGWRLPPVVGDEVEGRPRDWLAWRPNDQIGRLSLILTHSNAYVFDGSARDDVTPSGFVPGRIDTIVGSGYGAGLYGDDDYGTARTTSGSTLDAGMWTSDLFGETVICCFTGDETIYEYTNAPGEIVKPVTDAPAARAICVSDERQVFALGCDGDPSKVRWSDREDRNEWTPASTNRAGGYQMQNTSLFQCARRCKGQVLAWTQTELFAFAPTFNSTVYDRERLASQCGAMGPQSVCVVTDDRGETAYWMGPDGFYVYDGLVRRLECELHDYVLNDLNILQRAKFQVRSNKRFDEVWFFYCSAASAEIDRAVVYCYANSTWTKALISRLCWLDVGIFSLPLAIDADGVIYEHETGELAGAAAMPSYVLSHTFTIGGGDRGIDVDGFLPDMNEASGTAAVTFYYREVRNGMEHVAGPYQITPATEKIDLFLSARDMQVKFAGVSGYWELGLPQLRVAAGSGR